MHLDLERNCITTLESFVGILRTKALEFNASVNKLNRVFERYENIASKLTVIETIKENGGNDIKLYSMEMVGKIISSIWFELNDCVNHSYELIHKISKCTNDLYKSNREFTSAANAVHMLEDSSVVRGTHNRKPLNYYTEESHTLLHAWKTFCCQSDQICSLVNYRDPQTIEMMKQIRKTSAKCQELTDEYLLYCSMIVPNKRSK